LCLSVLQPVQALPLEPTVTTKHPHKHSISTTAWLRLKGAPLVCPKLHPLRPKKPCATVAESKKKASPSPPQDVAQRRPHVRKLELMHVEAEALLEYGLQAQPCACSRLLRYEMVQCLFQLARIKVAGHHALPQPPLEQDEPQFARLHLRRALWVCRHTSVHSLNASQVWHRIRLESFCGLMSRALLCHDPQPVGLRLCRAGEACAMAFPR